MKKYLIIVSVFILAGFAGFFSYAKFSENKMKPAATNTSNSEVVEQVALFEDRAEPDIITVPLNTFVQFNSKDGKDHEISSGAGEGLEHDGDHDHTIGGFESGVFKADEAYKLKFSQVGTYYFHDNLNPKISIVVIAY